MIKLSRLLGHERVTCVAHCSHNLLITDTLTKIPEAQALIYQCKDIVSALHFKAQEFVLEQKEAASAWQPAVCQRPRSRDQSQALCVQSFGFG